MKFGLSAVCVLLIAGTVTSLQAKPKPPVPSTGGVDLAVDSFASKVKASKGVSKINNVTVNVDNLGDTDAKKARIDWYLSDDDILTTASDSPTTPPDTLLHSQALGNIKAGGSKKRTMGGGLLKGFTPGAGQYLFVFVDSSYVLDEADEINNILSTPLP